MRTNGKASVDSLVGEYEGIDLVELDETAALRVRFDRKYLCSQANAVRVLDMATNGWRALEIANRRTFHYRTLYFDTPERDSFYGSARRRRHRFKVRFRSYDESTSAVLEVKTVSLRGQTIKSRLEANLAQTPFLSETEGRFVDQQTGIPGISLRLGPVMWTSYRRVTLADDSSGSRVSIDRDVAFAQPGDEDELLTESVVLETKTDSSPTTVDRALWSLGLRPVAFSKFSVACAVSDPTLPSNRWHRVIDRHVTTGLVDHRSR